MVGLKINFNKIKGLFYKSMAMGLFGFVILYQSLGQVNSSAPIVLLSHVDFREANIWVLSDLDKGELIYWDQNKPETKKTVPTNTFKKVNSKYVFTYKIGPLEPGSKYNYRFNSGPNSKTIASTVYEFKTPALWKWRTDAPDFKIALGSCNYVNQTQYDRPGNPYGDTSTVIFDNIAAKKPDLMFWLGDNIYLREPDWGSETGIYERYLHGRTQESTRKLWSSCPNYAIWDDHDFGPNDANGSFYNKSVTLQAFKDFWPNTGQSISELDGITYAFDYNDVHFIMLDDRYNRTPDLCEACPEETILGEKQLQWFKNSLLSLPSSEFKIVALGGQFLNSLKDYECYARWELEYQSIIDFIYKYNIKNVVFITGDRHFSELSILKKENKPTLYDFTVSPLTSGVLKRTKEVNAYRVEGSFYNANRSFGNIEFTGIEKERTIHFVLYDKFGTEVYRYSFLKE